MMRARPISPSNKAECCDDGEQNYLHTTPMVAVLDVRCRPFIPWCHMALSSLHSCISKGRNLKGPATNDDDDALELAIIYILYRIFGFRLASPMALWI